MLVETAVRSHQVDQFIELNKLAWLLQALLKPIFSSYSEHLTSSGFFFEASNYMQR